jgi:hypothetical protein
MSEIVILVAVKEVYCTRGYFQRGKDSGILYTGFTSWFNGAND